MKSEVALSNSRCNFAASLLSHVAEYGLMPLTQPDNRSGLRAKSSTLSGKIFILLVG